jgi:choloylglycine hydrolase
MRGNYLHYLIAEESGRSALVEFYKGEIQVHYNTAEWQAGTNFLLSAYEGDPEPHCWRYDLISNTLQEKQGRLSPHSAMRLLENVAQEHTQWSVVYRVTVGEIWVAMGRDYDQIYSFSFD